MALDLQTKKVLGIEVLVVPGDVEGPSIMLFHGFGADAYDLLPLSQVYKETPKPTWYFPHAPTQIEIAPGYFGRAWFEIDLERLKKALRIGDQSEVKASFPPDLKKARELGLQLIRELEIPFSKLVLGGFSQGAVLAAELSLNSFEKAAALLLLSGTLVNEEQWKKLAHQHAGMPFFQSHGLQDPILPIQGAVELAKVLQEGGLKGKLLTFKGGHEIPQPILVEIRKFLTTHLYPT